jgi:hypothetical protein
VTGGSGYPTDWFQNNPFLQSAAICGICHEVLRGPVIGMAQQADTDAAMNPCTHVFCKSCLTTWTAKKASCPSCRRSYHPKVTFTAVAPLQELVEQQCIVKCPLGCSWEGHLGRDGVTLRHHLADDCPQTPVECQFDPRHIVLPRNQQRLHEQECDGREMECPECRQLVRQLAKHREAQCPETLVPCPNGCYHYFITTRGAKEEGEQATNAPYHMTTLLSGSLRISDHDPQPFHVFTDLQLTETVRRQDLPRHLAADCPLQEVQCPYYRFGCRWSQTRLHLQQHLVEHVQQHADMAANTPVITGPFWEKYKAEDWRRRLCVGDLVDCLDTAGNWYISSVESTNFDRQVRVHFLGWSSKWDEILHRDSERLQRPFTHSTQARGERTDYQVVAQLERVGTALMDRLNEEHEE